MFSDHVNIWSCGQPRTNKNTIRQYHLCFSMYLLKKTIWLQSFKTNLCGSKQFLFLQKSKYECPAAHKKHNKCETTKASADTMAGQERIHISVLNSPKSNSKKIQDLCFQKHLNWVEYLLIIIDYKNTIRQYHICFQCICLKQLSGCKALKPTCVALSNLCFYRNQNMNVLPRTQNTQQM